MEFRTTVVQSGKMATGRPVPDDVVAAPGAAARRPARGWGAGRRAVQRGKRATGLQVPDDVVAALGGGKRPPVAVTLGTYGYRTTVAPMGGAFWIPLAAEHREAAGVQAGQEVDVRVELDTAPRETPLPQDLA